MVQHLLVNKSGFKGFILMMMFLLFHVGEVSAETIYWRGRSDRNGAAANRTEWNDSQNWYPKKVPGRYDDVIIGDADFDGVNSPIIKSNKDVVECKSLTIGGSKASTLKIDEAKGGVIVYGDVRILTNGVIENINTNLDVKGDWINNGNYNEAYSVTGIWANMPTVTFSGNSQIIGGSKVSSFARLYVKSKTTLETDLIIRPLVTSAFLNVSNGGVFDPSDKMVRWEVGPNGQKGNPALEVESGSTIKVNNTTYKANYSVWATTLQTNSTVEYIAAADQTNARLNGSVQSIYAPSILEVPYRNLKISGGGIRDIENSITVQENLIFTSGNIITGDNYKITLGSTAGRLIGENNTNYITGTVETTRSLTAAANSFGGMGIVITPAVDAGSTTVTRVTGYPAGQNETISRVFTVKPTNNLNTYNATIEFSYFDHELNGLQEGEYLGGLYSDTGWSLSDNSYWEQDPWNPHAYGIAQPDLNKVTYTKVNTLQRYTLGGVVTPMPVELISFTTSKKGADAVLNWTVASEENNSGFEVQASTDGYSFQKIGFVESKVITSNSKQEYSFTDNRNNKQGTIYYRLKQVDLDGKATTYAPRDVKFTVTAGTTVLAYPNPFTKQFKAELNVSQPVMAVLKLYSATGRLLLVREDQLQAGINVIKFDTDANLSKGMYILSAELGDEVYKIKLLKQ